jgi:hypothetical protein
LGSVGIGFVLYDILLAMADPRFNQALQLTAGRSAAKLKDE